MKQYGGKCEMEYVCEHANHSSYSIKQRNNLHKFSLPHGFSMNFPNVRSVIIIFIIMTAQFSK